MPQSAVGPYNIDVKIIGNQSVKVGANRQLGRKDWWIWHTDCEMTFHIRYYSVPAYEMSCRIASVSYTSCKCSHDWLPSDNSHYFREGLRLLKLYQPRYDRAAFVTRHKARWALHKHVIVGYDCSGDRLWWNVFPLDVYLAHLIKNLANRINETSFAKVSLLWFIQCNWIVRQSATKLRKSPNITYLDYGGDAYDRWPSYHISIGYQAILSLQGFTSPLHYISLPGSKVYLQIFCGVRYWRCGEIVG